MNSAEQKVRDYFPRGLVQPEGSFRFSIDALLLAAFIAPCGSGERLLDLGTGCGVVAIAMLLKDESLRAHGVDFNPDLVLAASKNAFRFGFSQRALFSLGDLSSCFAEDSSIKLEKSAYDIVLTNPPYRQRGKGRLPKEKARADALFEDGDTLGVFMSAAAYALKKSGALGMIYPAARFADALGALNGSGLFPSRILPVYSKVDKDASFVLIEAGKRPGPELAFQAPLILYEGSGPETRLTKAALEFCPDLGCNADRSCK